MKKILWLVILLPLYANANPYTEAFCLANPADDICIGFNEDRDRLNDLEDERSVPDLNELNSIQSNLLNHHFDLRKIGNDLYSCGQYQLYGCRYAFSGTTERFFGFRYVPRTASVRFLDNLNPNVFLFANPVGIATSTALGFDDLRFVGQANLASYKSVGQILVDDCDNPTVALMDQSRNPREPVSPPTTIMDNSGRVYQGIFPNPPITLVDVTDNTYGVLNFIVHADIVTPICTPGVSDRTGIWEQYSYSFVIDTNDPKFAGPWTYTGTSIGLLDRVEALENPTP